jgi:hypothetical protein
MEPSYEQCKSNDSSCRSMMTMETYDTTNSASISSGVSLDMDVHGITWATSPHLCNRSNHPSSNRVMEEAEKEYHARCGDGSGDSFNTFGESFMMDSFANSESFASSSFCNYDSCGRYQQQRTAPIRSTEDFSSILIIEEECEAIYAHDQTGNYATEVPTENTL